MSGPGPSAAMRPVTVWNRTHGSGLACDWWHNAERDVDLMLDMGHSVQLRLSALDETTQTRTPHPSARRYTEIIQAKATTWRMVEDYDPESLVANFPKRDESRRPHD